MSRSVAHSAGRYCSRSAGLAVVCVLLFAAPALAGPWSGAARVGPPGYTPNGLGFTQAGKGLLVLAAPDIPTAPSLAATNSRTGEFGASSALTRADDTFPYPNSGRNRQVGLFGRDGLVV